MKLIKLTDDHYVVVDNSEIKTKDIVLLPSKRIQYMSDTDMLDYLQSESLATKKITHSTIPKGMMLMEGIERLSLQEVKELIGEVDVEKKVQSLKNNFGYSTDDYYQGAEDGYNQALEDNKEKKYTEEDLAEVILRTIDACNEAQKDSYGELEIDEEAIIQSLQPKTEWEVEIIDGKLRLV